MKLYKYTITYVYDVGAWGKQVDTLKKGYVLASHVKEATEKIASRYSCYVDVTITVEETDFIEIE